MKTWSEHALILAKPPKEEQLTGTAGGAGLFLKSVTIELPNVTLYNTNQLLEAIRVMCNGWLMLGTKRVASQHAKDPAGGANMVPEWGLTETRCGIPSSTK